MHLPADVELVEKVEPTTDVIQAATPLRTPAAVNASLQQQLRVPVQVRAYPEYSAAKVHAPRQRRLNLPLRRPPLLHRHLHLTLHDIVIPQQEDGVAPGGDVGDGGRADQELAPGHRVAGAGVGEAV